MRRDLREQRDASLRKKYGAVVGDAKVEAIRLRKNAIQRKYNTSEHGKAVRERYRQSGRLAESFKRHDLKRYYGLTVEEWTAMFERQGRKCAVCGSTDPGRKNGQWSTDHDHSKGRGHARGIVCNSCNLVMGHVKDSTKRLQQIIDYLEACHDRYKN
jgi:hypothetical protein